MDIREPLVPSLPLHTVSTSKVTIESNTTYNNYNQKPLRYLDHALNMKHCI